MFPRRYLQILDCVSGEARRWGRYRAIERTAVVLALALGAAAVAAAVSVGPAPADLADGLVPGVPPDVDYGEVLPWLGFMLSGAAGMLWYSQWLLAKGYARSGREGSGLTGTGHQPGELSVDEAHKLQGWLRQMTLDNTVAVVGTLLVTLAFVVLGVELLRPEGLVPEEDRVAEVLGQLLGDVWGRVGLWLMVLAVFVGFWDTVLSDQDGFGRMFSRGIRLVVPAVAISEQRLRQLLTVVVLGVLPIGLYLLLGEPVRLLKLAGAIEAAQIPVVAVLTLALNRRLPPELRPSRAAVAGTSLAALFFAAFAVIYVVGLL